MVICYIYQLTRSSALTFSGVGMSLDTGASGGDMGGEGVGVGETLFWGQSGATVHKWGLYEVGTGLAVPTHLGSDIGSVSQPLDQQRLFQIAPPPAIVFKCCKFPRHSDFGRSLFKHQYSMQPEPCLIPKKYQAWRWFGIHEVHQFLPSKMMQTFLQYKWTILLVNIGAPDLSGVRI